MVLKSLSWAQGVDGEVDDYGNPDMFIGEPCWVRIIKKDDAYWFELIGDETYLSQVELHMFYDKKFPEEKYSYIDLDTGKKEWYSIPGIF